MNALRLLTAAALALLASASAPSATAVDTAPRRPPNVIVILADDLGYGDTGAYGSKIIRTPNIDGLAADGVRFTQGYVTHPVCAPSRAAIMTGRYQQRFGWEFNPVGRDRTGGVDLGQTFLAQVMKTAGYATGMVGKWHLGEAPGYFPLDRGFDEYFGVLGGATSFMLDLQPGDEAHTPPGSEGSVSTEAGGGSGLALTEVERMAHTRARAPVRRGREVVEVREYLTDAFTDDAVRFIGAHKDQPFFLYLAYSAPHTPLQAPRKYVDRYRHVPDKGQRVYAAMVSAVDDGVGAIRRKLKAEGIERDTLIVFLSDNGCAGYVGTACTNAPLNGYKGSPLEGGVRVPFIVSWPGRIAGGQVDGRTVSSLDIAPTAASLAGARMPNGSDGVDLMPYVTGRDRTTPNPTLFWRAGPNFAVRDGDWKLWQVNKAAPGQRPKEATGITPDGVQATVSPLGQHIMLYDLTQDQGETRNLAGERAEVVAGLQAKARAWDQGNIPAKWTSMRQGVYRFDDQLLQIYN